MVKTYYGDELYHYGVKGMHWGVRRYQNADGTLTDAGKRRERKQYHKAVNKQRREDHKYRNTLSDEELDNKIRRLEKEKRYSELTTGKRQSTEPGTLSKAAKTAIGMTVTAAAVTGMAFVVKSGVMKMAVRSLTNKTIKAGRNIVDKQLSRYMYNPEMYSKWLKVEKLGKVAAKDLRNINLDEVAKHIKLKKK